MRRVLAALVIVQITLAGCGLKKGLRNHLILRGGGSASGFAVGHGMGFVPATRARLSKVPYALTPPAPSDGLPASVDLSTYMPPPGDQGTAKTCVGWAVAYGLKSYQEALERRATVALGGDEVFSPDFLYNQIRRRRGGATLVDAFTLLVREGAATVAEAPAAPGATRRRAAPPPTHRIDLWRRLDPADVDATRAHLAAKFPVVIGLDMDEDFATARPGFVWRKRGRDTGGHAMVAVGYDDHRQAFKVQNSWGTVWGDGGYGWISYDLFPRVVAEAYIAKDARDDAPAAGRTPRRRPDVDPGTRPADLSVSTDDSGRDPPFAGQWRIPAGFGRRIQIALYDERRAGETGGSYAACSPVYDIAGNGPAAGRWEIGALDPARPRPRRLGVAMFVDGFGIADDAR